MKPPAQAVVKQIHSLTAFLVEAGLADDQNLPVLNQKGHVATIACPNANYAALLKDRPYAESYLEQATARSYNLKMLDGALVQMSYEFNKKSLTRARLAFLPSPTLLEFQNNPEIYLEELLYADVVEKKAVTVPLRFDFDARAGVAKPLDHPISHLTLGQYSACRIAARGALTPAIFMSFLIRSFYGLARAEIGELPSFSFRFSETIFAEELELVHIGVPCAV